MAELAKQSGVSVPTIKYYLREGLLQPGHRTSVNQASYGEKHLQRLRLIRALVTVAKLPIEKVREVVQVVSKEPPVIEAMAITQDALVGNAEMEVGNEMATQLLAEIISARGWNSHEGSPAHVAAVNAIARLQKENFDAILGAINDYAEAADTVGRIDVQAVAVSENLEAMIRGVVLGSVLRRPLLDALVLLAQQHYAQCLNQEGADPIWLRQS